MSSVFDSFKGLKVLIIGDVMVDSYLWGKIERISPEAPVPIVTLDKTEHRLGGAANVALNVLSLGAKPVLCSAIGNDENGKLFNKLAKAHGLSTDGIIEIPGRITTEKKRIISGNQQIIRIDSEEDTPLDSATTRKFIKTALAFLIDSDVIIFQDYDKGLITNELITSIVSKANIKNIPVAVDPKKRNFHFYKNVTLFKPNFKELQDGLKTELSIDNTEEIRKAADKLIQLLSLKIAMITLSYKGIFICGNGHHDIIPTKVKSIIDVSGAGDTVISIAALGLAVGLSNIQIASLANIAAGIVCEKVGVVPVDIKSLKLLTGS